MGKPATKAGNAGGGGNKTTGKAAGGDAGKKDWKALGW